MTDSKSVQWRECGWMYIFYVLYIYKALSGIKRSNVTKVQFWMTRTRPTVFGCLYLKTICSLRSTLCLFLTLVLCAEHLSTKADYFLALASPEASEAVCPFLTFQLWSLAMETSVVVIWSLRKSRSPLMISTFLVADSRFLESSASASSMGYSSITLAPNHRQTYQNI